MIAAGVPPAARWMVPALVLAGCATPAPPPGAGPPSFVVLETLPAGPPVRGVDLYPMRPAERVFELHPADAPAGTAAALITERATTTDRFGASLAVSEGGRRTEFRMRLEAGDTVMPAVIAHDERALTLFDPPLLLTGAEIPPGAPRQVEVTMRVVDAANPSRQRESGKAVSRIEYVNDQRIKTPLGEHRAKRVVVHFTARLRLASVDRTTTYWLVPGLGVLARKSEEIVRVLGLPVQREHEWLVLRGP